MALQLPHRRLRARWPAEMKPPQLLATTELVFWVALARIATWHHVRQVRVTATAGPEHGRRVLRCAPPRGPTESITFAAEDAARPFLTENEPIWSFFAPELRRRLADLQAIASAADRVRAALLETPPAGDSTIKTVTHHLATSPRTLQRQLQLEGTSFQAVLADTREHLARHYRAQSAMTTAEIAYMLAYDDTNSFFRACRSWTGSTPDTVRTANTATAAAGAGR